VDALLHAIVAPKRREILRLVRRRERSAGEIHRALGGLTFGAVSQHLGVLEASGLVSVRRAGRSRLYAARPAGLAPLRRWLESMWDDALARLAQQAEAEEARGGGPRASEGRRPAERARAAGGARRKGGTRG
jgi:DNA-binding transcriptional ArsR family regulator